ncbi:MAG TPA: tetratricopeptide repeat protein, partial [Acidimicrobiales bacterium]|nr:tetratricopeptide repeat protein [Acidimicrobiales bacterium]
MPFDPSSGLVDVILGIAALATLVAVIRAWKHLWDDQFTVADRRLAAQVAVFLVPPVVVLLHELGHLVAARALGVEVTSSRYGLFDGSVTLAGPMSPGQDWFIALAGNLVGAVAGLALVAAGVLGRKLRRPVRYVLVAGGVLELLFTLVMYPLLSFLGSFGDWVVIYDAGRTPALSWATGVVHAAALVGLWRWWRGGGRALLFAVSTGTESRVAELRGAIDADPRDPEPWLLLADFYARNGDLPLARGTLDEAVAACGDVPRLHLGRARVSLFQGRWNDAVLAA